MFGWVEYAASPSDCNYLMKYAYVQLSTLPKGSTKTNCFIVGPCEGPTMKCVCLVHPPTHDT